MSFGVIPVLILILHPLKGRVTLPPLVMPKTSYRESLYLSYV